MLLGWWANFNSIFKVLPTMLLLDQQPVKPGRHVVELFCGSASSVQYHLTSDPSTQAIVVDVLSESEICDLIPSQFHDQITFYGNTDVRDVRFRDLQQIWKLTWDILVAHLDAVHASSRCMAMSCAQQGKGPLHFVGVALVSGEAV